jgi:PAS domain S-box-containing protein
VSGTIGEDVAVQAMKAGAHDYVLKYNLSRLAPAVECELLDAEVRRERRLAESRYSNLFNTVPVGILSAASERGAVLEANSTFLEMLGFKDVESLKRVDFKDLWVHPDEFARLLKVLRNEGLVQNFELEFYRQDGNRVVFGKCARNMRRERQGRPLRDSRDRDHRSQAGRAGS